MGDRGSVLPSFFLLVLGGMLVLGLALDLGRWASSWREVAFAADAGAEAGAAMLDTGAAYRGLLRLDGAEAVAVAEAAAAEARPRMGRHVAARATPSRVCVTVRQPFQPTILRAVGVGSRQIAARACAVPGQG